MKNPYRPLHVLRLRRQGRATSQPPRLRRPAANDGGEADRAMIDNAIAPLMEHFDTVQVFVTRHGNDGTAMIPRGRGNFYARLGGVREWLVREDEDTRHCARRIRSDGDGAAF